MSLLNTIEAELRRLLSEQLGYLVDPDTELSIFEMDAADYPVCVIDYGEETEDVESDRDAPNAFFQSSTELILSVVLYEEEADFKTRMNEERAKLKQFTARNYQFADGVVDLKYISSRVGRTGRTSPPIGGLEVVFELIYREPRELM